MKLILVEKLKNGDVTESLLSEVRTMHVTPDASYTVFDEATMEFPEGMILRRKGAALEVVVEEEIVLNLEGFYDDVNHAVFSIDGSAGEAVDGIVWQAKGPLNLGAFVLAGQTALGGLAVKHVKEGMDGKDGIDGGIKDNGDSTPPHISAVSIPDDDMKVGDAVVVTLTVDDDGGDTYGNLSGTVGGFALGNLTRVDSTTYTAEFTVTEGGSDVAAGADIPVSITLDDSAGNTSSAFTDAIRQVGDSIDANLPATPSAPNLAPGSDTGVLGDNITANNMPTFTGTAEANSTVEVLSSIDGVLGATTADGSGTWSFTAGALASGAHEITATATDAAGNTSVASPPRLITLDSTAPDAPSAPDLDSGSDTGVSNEDNITDDATPTFNGTAEANSTVEVTSSVDGVLGTAVVDNSGDWSFTAGTLTLGTHDITATVTDASGNTSIASPALSLTLVASGTTVAITDDTVGTATGDVTFTFTFSEGVTGFDVGDITVSGGSKGTFTAVSGSVYTLVVTPDSGSTADITVDVAADVATDTFGNGNIAAIQAVQPVDTIAPVITGVSIPDAGMRVGDAVTVTLNVTDDSGEDYTNLTGTVGGFALGGLTRVDNTTYTAEFTVAEGGDDVAAIADIPVSVTLDDSAGNTSPLFNTPISQLGDSIDATSPSISGVSIPDVAMRVGDIVTVTFAASDAGLSLVSGSINGVAVTDFTDNGGGSYSVIYTVTEGDTDRAAGEDIPVSLVVQDGAGNTGTFNSSISQASDAIDANAPVISAASIPDLPMTVGDVVLVTLTVEDDGGDAYTNLSGTVGGFALGNLSRLDSTTYTGEFTVVEGGSDVAAGADIPVSLTLDDSAGNTSALFTTPISQANDGIEANTLSISAVSIPDVPMIVGDVVTVTLTVGDDGGVSYSNLSGNVGGFALSNLVRVNSTTYTAQYTVTEGGGDVAAGADIPVSVTLEDSMGNTSPVFSTPISQSGDSIDANSPIISGVSIPDVAMRVGDTVTVTFNASEAGLSLVNGTINGAAVTDFTDNSGGSYSATYTVAEGDTDRAAGEDIPVSFVLEDGAGNTGTFNTPISQANDAIDASSPVISAASIPDVAMFVGDVVLVTLTVDDDGGDVYTNLSGTVGGFALGNLSRINSTTYTGEFTVVEGGGDVAADADIPVSLTLDDSAGNTSTLFTTPISQANDGIDANTPSISAVSIPDATMMVGDVVTVTLTVADDGGVSYSNLSGTVGGFAVSGLGRVNSTTYTAQFTVTEGGSDVAAGTDIPVSMTLEDSTGNISPVFSTPISQSGDAIDANSPSISAVSIPDVAMSIGDTVTVTITASEAGLSLSSGTINGVTVTGFTDNTDGSYNAIYTVAEGGIDRAAGDDIPVSFVLVDSAGNASAAFTTPISQGSDAIDANTPSISAVNIPNAPMNVGDIVTVTITASEAGLILSSGTVNGVAVTGFTDDGGGNYSATYTVAEGDTDRAAGDDIPVSFVLQDVAGNISAEFTTPISQGGDAIDAGTPTISAVSIPNAPMNVGDLVTVTITASEAGLSLSSGTINGANVTGFSDDGGGTYSATYTVSEGDIDRTAGEDIPISFVLEDSAGNTSAAFATPISQAGDAIDANSPTLSASSPSDDATNVAPDANIVLHFNEDIALGTGNIVISDGADIITIDVASHGGQLSVSGTQLTINPNADLANSNANYNVQVAPTAITDTVGNAYAGIADASTLNFTTEMPADTSIVVFDLTAGTSSEHSSRTFDPGTDYTIYIVVDSTSNALSSPATAWTGAGNLTGDDQVILVGSGSAIMGALGGEIAASSGTSFGITWGGAISSSNVAQLFADGKFSRNTVNGTPNVDLWTGSASALGRGGFASNLPTSIAATQALS